MERRSRFGATKTVQSRSSGDRVRRRLYLHITSDASAATYCHFPAQMKELNYQFVDLAADRGDDDVAGEWPLFHFPEAVAAAMTTALLLSHILCVCVCVRSLAGSCCLCDSCKAYWIFT